MPNCMSFRELRRQTKLARMKRDLIELYGADSEIVADFSRNSSCEFEGFVAPAVTTEPKHQEREYFDYFVSTLISLASRELENEKLNGEGLISLLLCSDVRLMSSRTRPMRRA
jgi:hypothetical protein